jgi:hypothetical protein
LSDLSDGGEAVTRKKISFAVFVGGAIMPTAEQCKTYANEYQLLGREAEISIRRATVLLGISLSWTTLANQLDRLSAIVKDES